MPIVPQHLADKYAEQMKQPDLVFLTADNQKQVLSAAAQQECAHEWVLKIGDMTRHHLCEKCGLIDER